MSTITPNTPSTNRKTLFFAGIFFLSLFAFTLIVGTLALSSSHENYQGWLSEQAPVIILDTGSTIFYGTPVFLVAIFVLGCYGIYVGIKGERRDWFDRMLVKPLGIMIVVGLVLMFLGKHTGTAYWENRIASEGYLRCNGSFVLTGKWAIDVWARSPSICMDPKLKDALRHSRGTVYEINDYYSPPEDLAGPP